MRLRFFERKIQRTHLQHTVRVLGRKTQGGAPVHNVFTQSQGDIGNAVLRFLMPNGVVIQGTCHT